VDPLPEEIGDLGDISEDYPLAFVTKCDFDEGFSSCYNDKQRRYIIAYAYMNRKSSLAIAGLGRFLMYNAHKGDKFYPNAPNDYDPIGNWSMEKLAIKIAENVSYLANRRTCVPLPEKNECYRANASDFVEGYQDFEGAVVHFDPAWPWKEKPSEDHNPYKFVNEVVGSILQGKNDKLDIWWGEDVEPIKRDVCNWTETALKKGARMVLVNTQSTNHPPADEVAGWFKNAEVRTYSTDSQLKRPDNNLDPGCFVETIIIVEP
jgi:hypothetical protein